MFLNGLPVPVLLLTSAFAAINIRRGGWLDRVVQFHKERFLNDVVEVAPVKINATIIPRPPGYKDSPQWDYESVMRLLTLLRESETAAPVHRALRRMMRPSRRIMMGYKESFQFFPRFPKDNSIDMYYDTDSEEYNKEMTRSPLEDGVIVVSNPVESRLPSAQISVKLLEEIMVARAIAARALPSTSKPTIPWTPMNKTSSASSKTTASSNTTVSMNATTPSGKVEEEIDEQAEEEATKETEKEEGEEEGEEKAEEGGKQEAEEQSEKEAEKEEGAVEERENEAEKEAEEEVGEEKVAEEGNEEAENEGKKKGEDEGEEKAEEEEGNTEAEEGAEDKAEEEGGNEEGAEEEVEEGADEAEKAEE